MMPARSNIYLIWKVTAICIFIIPTDLLYTTENRTTDELYEAYGLTNPFKATKAEKKYEKRRHKLEVRWGIDIYVSKLNINIIVFVDVWTR